MKIFKFYKDENGAVLPIVAIGLVLIVFMFSALTVDVGMLYVEKRNMVAAADAASLAGAQELYSTKTNIEIGEIAKDVAIRNGADELSVKVTVDKSISNIYKKPYVKVDVTQNTPLFFAKIISVQSIDVAATSVASSDKIEFNDFVMPLAGLYEDFYRIDGTVKSNTAIYFHERKGLLGEQSWSGLLDLDGNGTNAIVDLISNRKQLPISSFMTQGKIDYLIDVSEGWKTFQTAFDTLLNNSALKPTKLAREEYMTSYIPIVQNVNTFNKNEGVPILQFAKFVIVDYFDKIHQGESIGLSNHYSYNIEVNGDIEVNFDTYIKNSPEILNLVNDKTILGYFTGDILTLEQVYKSEVIVYLIK